MKINLTAEVDGSRFDLVCALGAQLEYEKLFGQSLFDAVGDTENGQAQIGLELLGQLAYAELRRRKLYAGSWQEFLDAGADVDFGGDDDDPTQPTGSPEGVSASN